MARPARIYLAIAAAAMLAAPGATTASLEAELRSQLERDPLLIGRSPEGARLLAIGLFLGRADAGGALERWASDETIAPAVRSDGWLLLCEEHLRRSHFAKALAACAEGDRLSGKDATEGLRGILTALASVPPPKWRDSGSAIPLTADSDGTRRLMIGPAGRQVSAIVDTGAEFSVMMESVARRFDGRRLGSGSVATVTSPVAGEFAVIDRLPVGDHVIENLVVTVLPDSALTFSDTENIPAIIGLPALMAAGQVAFVDHGRALRLGRAALGASDKSWVPLYWDPSGVGFAAGFAKGVRAVHFDTGAVRTDLFPSSRSILSHAELASGKDAQRKMQGIGGSEMTSVTRLARVTVSVGGQPWTIAPVDLLAKGGNGEAASVGVPLLDRFERVLLDFEAMRMSVD